MKIHLPLSSLPRPDSLLRKAGYAFFIDPNTKQESYILRLSPDRYPRLHIYIRFEGKNVIIDLHLDQKAGSYEGTSKHAGEYEGATVEREMERIKRWVAHDSGQTQIPISVTPQDDKNQTEQKLFGGIF